MAVQPPCAAGLRSHRGPILTVANWSGQWPGLVGLLNLNGRLLKSGVNFQHAMEQGLSRRVFPSRDFASGSSEGKITHDPATFARWTWPLCRGRKETRRARSRSELKSRKAILGVFDEGCMGMYNAIIDDDLLNTAGVFKERLSQSALVAAMRTVSR